MRDHSKSYSSTDSGGAPWERVCRVTGFRGLVFRTGYGWVPPYRLPYSLDGQLPAAYSSVKTILANPAISHTTPLLT